MEIHVCFRVINVLCASRNDKLPVEPQSTLCEREGPNSYSDYWKIIVNYDLIVIFRPNNVFMYYEMIQAAKLAYLYSLKLLMIVPLKTMNVQFTLYRVSVLPVPLFNHSFVQFEVEKDYFGIDVRQRNYLTLTEVDLVK
jgi:hypothetical protein